MRKLSAVGWAVGFALTMVSTSRAAQFWEDSIAYNSSTVNSSAQRANANPHFVDRDQATLHMLAGESGTWTALDSASIKMTGGSLRVLFGIQ